MRMTGKFPLAVSAGFALLKGSRRCRVAIISACPIRLA